ncbi:helix-turn-helix domain-containing protein [Streptomyces iconiensis]|uniref:Helix-turn-helix domain-containing protein n=1 Tax=Streptomyces iconiensis TaxID=1384038 RepID=A0ABT7A5C7_9ACTN|nr:helix-turn-helix domain-containing protein [Streptomyces iconiensis]MDJ1136272.1 helix-turn-helix domain-containing protein [Streptomyces iconiensis]
MCEQDHQARALRNELGTLLRAWRKRATRPQAAPAALLRRRGPGLTQRDVARLTRVSVTWYRELERGAPRDFGMDLLQDLAAVLDLSDTERTVLFQLALGHPPPLATPVGDEPVSPLVQPVLEALPYPAYISNLWWDIVAANSSHAHWFPSLGGNPMRWLFLTAEARQQLIDWPTDWALPALAEIRYALALHPDCAELQRLRDDILRSSPEASRLWANNAAQARPDQRVRRLRLPVREGTTAVQALAFAPLDAPSSRLIILQEQTQPEGKRREQKY